MVAKSSLKLNIIWWHNCHYKHQCLFLYSVQNNDSFQCPFVDTAHQIIALSNIQPHKKQP